MIPQREHSRPAARAPRARRQGGYSLVEILVAIGLGMVALGSFTAFNRFQLFALRNQATQLDLQTTARTIVDLMAREMRRAGLDPTCAKNFAAISRAGGTQIRIRSDLNGSGDISGADENIRYRYNSSNRSIERITSSGTDVLLDGVPANSFSFAYFDADGTQLSPNSLGDEIDILGTSGFLSSGQRTSVRRVRIQLALTEDAFDPQNDVPLRATVSTDVDLRNRYFLGSTVCP